MLAGLTAACASVSGLPRGVDTSRYESCDDPVAIRALDEARVRLEEGRLREAVPLLRRVLELCPEHVPTHERYQDVCTQLGGDEQAAMEAYYRDLPGEPPSAVVRYARARLLEHVATRMAALEALLAEDPGFYYAHFSQARLQRSVDHLDQAVDSFRNALEVNPDMVAAHLELAEVLVELRRFREAEPHYARYVAARPDDREARHAYVRLLLYELGRVDEAAEHLAVLYGEDRDDPELLMDRAAVAWRAGRLPEAESLYLEVLSRRPDDARALLNLGNLYFGGLGRDPESMRRYWPKARKAYQDFLKVARTEGAMDLFDYHLTIPFRLDEIEKFLAAGDG